MHFLIQVFFTSLLSYIFQQFFTAWIVVPVAMFVALTMENNKPFAKFLGGFAAISLLWMGKATIIDVYTNAILSTKVVAILGIKSVMMLILLTGFIGGILGGCGAASGQYIRNLFFAKNKKHDLRFTNYP
jgi:hypothetical protein